MGKFWWMLDLLAEVDTILINAVDHLAEVKNIRVHLQTPSETNHGFIPTPALSESLPMRVLDWLWTRLLVLWQLLVPYFLLSTAAALLVRGFLLFFAPACYHLLLIGFAKLRLRHLLVGLDHTTLQAHFPWFPHLDERHPAVPCIGIILMSMVCSRLVFTLPFGMWFEKMYGLASYPLPVAIFSMVAWVETFGLLGMRSACTIRYFPMLFANYFFLLHIYLIRFHYNGFLWLAFGTFFFATIHAIVHFWDVYEVPCVDGHHLSVERPRQFTFMPVAALLPFNEPPLWTLFVPTPHAGALPQTAADGRPFQRMARFLRFLGWRRWRRMEVERPEEMTEMEERA